MRLGGNLFSNQKLVGGMENNQEFLPGKK